jgi:hypothetical protein
MSGMILPIKLTWLAGLLTFVCLFFAPALVQAQDNQIVPGLCSGANLEFTQNPTTADCNNGGENVTSAKNTILYAVIGLIIVALAQIIVRFTLSKLANA